MPFRFKKTFLCSVFTFLGYCFMMVGLLTSSYFGNSFWASPLHLYTWSELLVFLFFLAGECYPYKKKKTNFLEKNYGFFLQYVLFIMLISKNAADANNFYDGINSLDYALLVVCWLFYAVSLLALVVILVSYVLLLRGYKDLNMKKLMRFGVILLLISMIAEAGLEALSIATENLSRLQLIEFTSCVLCALMDTIVFYFFYDSIELKKESGKDSKEK